MPTHNVHYKTFLIDLDHTLFDSDAFYIGALGSKGNHKKRLEPLTELGYSK